MVQCACSRIRIVSVTRCTGACTGGHASSARNFLRREALWWIHDCCGVDWRARRRTQVSRRMRGVHVNEGLSAVDGHSRRGTTNRLRLLCRATGCREGRRVGRPLKKCGGGLWGRFMTLATTGRRCRGGANEAGAVVEQQERPCHAALSTCMAQDENAAAAGCQKECVQ